MSDPARAKALYESVLGLTPVPRPPLPYPGEWYDLSNGQQLHLMDLSNPDAGVVRPEHGGRDRHIALGIADVGALRSGSSRPASATRPASRDARRCSASDANALEFVELS